MNAKKQIICQFTINENININHIIKAKLPLQRANSFVRIYYQQSTVTERTYSISDLCTQSKNK